MVELVILVGATKVPTRVEVDKEDLVVARTTILVDPAVDEGIQMVQVEEDIKEVVSDLLQLRLTRKSNQLSSRGRRAWLSQSMLTWLG